MDKFLSTTYLLDSALAVELYEETAKQEPIFDFHCHLQPSEIYEDKHYQNITQCWLFDNGHGDHYKWRLMREAGIDEKYITGKASDKEKFMKFAEALPSFIGNPIYEWCHLELRHYFGINETLSLKNAERIYNEANEKLKSLSARKMMEISNVKEVFTTDDPLDDLHYHQALKKDDSFKIEVRPCWRPDSFIKIDNEAFLPYIRRFEKLIDKPISSFTMLLEEIDKRLDFFLDEGCLASDHSLEGFHYHEPSSELSSLAYKNAYEGKPLSNEEIDAYKSTLLAHLGEAYHKHGMVQQYHVGAYRNVAKRRYKLLGPDSGYDCVRDDDSIMALASLLNKLDENEALPKTIIYNLNPKDELALSVLANSFPGAVKGQVQMGAAWWFNDCYSRIKERLELISNTGLLSNFVGMVTDSRSFLSYPRHDYFRRILCSYIAKLVDEGRYPEDIDYLKKLVADICYNNAKSYFYNK